MNKGDCFKLKNKGGPQNVPAFLLEWEFIVVEKFYSDYLKEIMVKSVAINNPEGYEQGSEINFIESNCQEME